MSTPFVLAHVFETDGVTMICELPRRWGVTFSEPLNQPGMGTVTVSLSDPVLLRHDDLLRLGNVVKFWLGDGLGNGKYVHGFRIRNRTTSFVDTDEYAGYVREVSGPSLHGDLARWIVQHQTENPRYDASETRSFSWTAPHSSEWYDADDWTENPTSAVWTDPPSEEKQKKPKGWPDRGAYWLWHEGGGVWGFWRRTVNVDADVTVKFFVTSDEIIRFYIDGDLVIDKDGTETGYKEFSDYTTTMTAGEHVFAALMRTKESPGGDGNDSWIMTATTLDGDGKPDTVMWHTTPTTWRYMKGLPPPGWRPAGILHRCMIEARERGVDTANQMIMGFTAVVDSNNDDWTGREISKEVSIGTDGLDLQQQLSEIGHFDVWVDPATMTLEAWPFRGVTRTGMAFEPGRNMMSWTVEESEDTINALLVKYEQGWARWDSEDSVEEYGRMEGYVSLSSTTDQSNAEYISESIGLTMGAAIRKAGASDEVKHSDDTSPSGALIAVPGMVPMVDFATGDRVMAPNRDAEMVLHRIMALSCTEDADTGQLSWDPELVEL